MHGATPDPAATKSVTLVAHRRYFGLDALHLRKSASRLLTRVVGLGPERARLRPAHLARDFAMDTRAGAALVEQFVAGGLLRRDDAAPDALLPTDRLHALAAARVVEPLPRERARRLVSRACDVVRKANAEWVRNALEVDTLAVFGSYMSRDALLRDLSLGVVVRARDPERRVRWGRLGNRSAGAAELREALQALSSFVIVHFVTDSAALPRPFSVVYRLDA
jgi:hypothetical protein